MRAPFLIGRLLFGGYFIVSGINHFKNKGQMTQYTASKNIPQPEVAVPDPLCDPRHPRGWLRAHGRDARAHRRK